MKIAKIRIIKNSDLYTFESEVNEFIQREENWVMDLKYEINQTTNEYTVCIYYNEMKKE